MSQFATIDPTLGAESSFSQFDKYPDYYDGREDVSHFFQNQSTSSESSPSDHDNFAPSGNLDAYTLFDQDVTKSFVNDNPPWYNDNDLNDNDLLFAQNDFIDHSNFNGEQSTWQSTMDHSSTTMTDCHDPFQHQIPQTEVRPVLEPIITSIPTKNGVSTHMTSATSSTSDGTTTASTPTTFKSESPASEPLSPDTQKHPERTRRRRSTRQQEEAALDKQRERNRLAAGRCRKKQIERSQKLTDRAENLEKNRAELHFTVAMLNAQVLGLKEELLRHNDCGCGQIREYLQWRVEKLLEQPRRTCETQQPSQMDAQTSQMDTQDSLLEPSTDLDMALEPDAGKPSKPQP